MWFITKFETFLSKVENPNVDRTYALKMYWKQSTRITESVEIRILINIFLNFNLRNISHDKIQTFVRYGVYSIVP